MTDGSGKKPKKPRKRKTPVAGTEITEPASRDSQPEVAEPTSRDSQPEVAEPTSRDSQPEVAEPARPTEPAVATEPAPESVPASEPAPVSEPAPASEPAPIPAAVATFVPEPDAAPPVLPPVLPTPAEAALDAARIVSEMVDIDSESGAIIAAAAAAGAAIEAAVTAQKVAAAAAAASSDSLTKLPGAQAEGDTPPPFEAGANDPLTTVRLSRERILRALDEEAAGAGGPSGPRQPRARTEPGAVRARSEPGVVRARTEPGVVRARTEPGVADADEPEEEFDPVAIAAAAIGRLRHRARTDLAELRVHYHRHDVFVLLLALVIIVAAGRVHARLVTPPEETFSERGLTFAHSSAWLKPEPVAMPAPRLLRDPIGALPKKDDALYHVELTSTIGTARIEVLVDRKPAWSNIVTGLELDRRTRWGELYTLDDSAVRSIAGHDWLRTAYRYAHAELHDMPRVDRAIEYATIDRDQIYVITLFGTPRELDQMDEVLEPSLRVPTQTGLPLVPQTSRLSQRTYPGAVGRAFDSTVMVVVADLVDGRLKARGGGSGVIVGGDGSILTNYHVIHDKDGRLHDAFIIGRFSAIDQAPQLACAGRPNRSKLDRDHDLALIKCDMDLDGRMWIPSSGSGVWATLPEARTSEIKMGQRLWVLGYPDVGGGGLTLSEGEVEGWTGEDGTQGKDFLKTDASITHGNSGGPVVDDQGKLVGVASAFRTRITANGGVIETAQVGLVRPLSTASQLLNYAATNWTPLEGHTEVELTPTAVEAAAEGVRIFTTVIDDATEAPIRDAMVAVLRPGVNASTIDMNRLDDQTIAWGRTNSAGEVRLKQLVPIPGTYTVMVTAPGYETLFGDSELHLDAKTPPSFDPWGKIGLRAR